MEDYPEKKNYFAAEEYIEQLRIQRKKLRATIKKIMEEVSGNEYAIEDDLSEILKSFPKEQQASVNAKLVLAMTLPEEEE
jgi:hypothetical protein